jgi:hypothetical protein
MKRKQSKLEMHMLRNITTALFMASFLADLVAADSISSPSNADWGERSCEAQLSIVLSSNTVTAGSTAVLHTRIRNTGTNDVSLVVIRQFPYTLTNELGGIYKVTPPMFENDLKNTVSLEDFVVHAGTTNEWPDHLQFGKDIVPGDYVIMPITRSIRTADSNVCALISNSLKVRVVKSN